jgi:hypothetical protein
MPLTSGFSAVLGHEVDVGHAAALADSKADRPAVGAYDHRSLGDEVRRRAARLEALKDLHRLALHALEELQVRRIGLLELIDLRDLLRRRLGRRFGLIAPKLRVSERLVRPRRA